MKNAKNIFVRFASVAGFALLFVAAFLLVCDKVTAPDITISTSDGTSPGANDNTKIVMSTYVGYGIDVFSGPTYVDALKSRVFKNIVYKDTNSTGGNSYIDISNAPDVYTTFWSSEEITDVYSKLDVHVNVKTGKAVPFFSGGFRSQFNTSNKLKSKSMFYNSIFSTFPRKSTLSVSGRGGSMPCLAVLLQSYLSRSRARVADSNI